MAVFADLIRWKIEVSVLALTGLVAATLMAGTTNTSRLLYGSVCARKRRQDQYFSPERVRLLLFTAGAGLHYLTLVLNSPTLALFLTFRRPGLDRRTAAMPFIWMGKAMHDGWQSSTNLGEKIWKY
jgi:hypothetical protein